MTTNLWPFRQKIAIILLKIDSRAGFLILETYKMKLHLELRNLQHHNKCLSRISAIWEAAFYFSRFLLYFMMCSIRDAQEACNLGVRFNQRWHHESQEGRKRKHVDAAPKMARVLVVIKYYNFFHNDESHVFPGSNFSQSVSGGVRGCKIYLHCLLWGGEIGIPDKKRTRTCQIEFSLWWHRQHFRHHCLLEDCGNDPWCLD